MSANRFHKWPLEADSKSESVLTESHNETPNFISTVNFPVKATVGNFAVSVSVTLAVFTVIR